MGYAAPAQIGHGIHTRLRARSYIVTSDDDKDRVAFVSMDAGMGSDILNIRVLPRLAELLGDDSLYTIENVAISGTHSHSGPAGFLQYILYQFTSLGYVAETTDTFVESVAQSLFKAHKNLVPGEIMINESGDDFLTEANINRSPSSYLLNPQAERDEHSAQGDTDKNMMLLKFVDNDQNELGMLNWFAVHGTNMNNTNKLYNSSQLSS